MNILYIILLLFFSIPYNLSARVNNAFQSTNVKLLILIIASDEQPLYIELQKIWRSYMHLHPKHVEAYFIKACPNLQSPYLLDGDTLWVDCHETIKPGIINKTVMSLEYFLPIIMSKFDYVLRTNLSSFYILPKLLDRLKTCPRKQFYFGSACGIKTPESKQITVVASGSGFILSPDLVAMLVKHKNEILNNQYLYDDEIIGLFFKKHKVPLQRHARADFYSLQEWHSSKHKISNQVFHYRIKGPTWEIRLKDDLYIHKELLKQHYKVAFNLKKFRHQSKSLLFYDSL